METIVTQDPLVEAGRKHRHALGQWEKAAEESPTGNWDTPECEHWFGERMKYLHQLQNTEAISLQGLQAQLEMIEAEFGDGDSPIEINARAFSNIKLAVENLGR